MTAEPIPLISENWRETEAMVRSDRSLAQILGDAGAPGSAPFRRRIGVFLRAVGRAAPERDEEALDALYEAVEAGGPPEVWLALAVLGAHLPDSDAVVHTVRAVRLDGARIGINRGLEETSGFDPPHWPDVEVLTGQVLVDAHHTFYHPDIATGIQRVARQVARRWRDDHQPVFVAWTGWFLSLQRLSDAGVEQALAPVGRGIQNPVADLPSTVVVPWRSTYVVPELAAENLRAERFKALLRFSRSSSALIGFDCVPLTAAETTAEGMAGAFALYLSAAADTERIAAISGAAASEYRGWKRMLTGVGVRGPDIRPIVLPVEAQHPSPEAIQQARSLLGVGPLPIVLAVGSHEPRKNHLSVLHAAELLWREGQRFTLAFVGGNSWRSEIFAQEVQVLQGRGRPVQPIVKLSDDLLWAAYRLAYCTVFTSLHEGFGLPVAESLACGTPVITSNFGSMREIAEGGGALMVDPRDDAQLADALRRLLTDTHLHARLAREAGARTERTWDDYARETWAYLVDGPRPG